MSLYQHFELTEYKQDLEKDLISETSGDFSKHIVALFKALSEELNNKKPAAKIWIKILTTRHPDHLKTVLSKLQFEKGQTVDEALVGHFKGVLSGDLKKDLKTLVRCIQNQHLYLAQQIQTMKKQFKGELLLALLAICHAEDHIKSANMWKKVCVHYRL